MPILAIDFGTTTTVAAVRAEGSPARLVAIDGSPLMPSSVFLTDTGTLTVGRDADRQARLDPSRYEPNPKRRIDDGEVMLGVAALPVVELVAAVLRRVADEVGRQFGSIPTDVRLTHPARWGRPRRRLLLEAAAAAGLGEPSLIPEPVAAATHYAHLGFRAERSMRSGAGEQSQLGPDAGVAVYDLGGGTFDVAVLRRSGPTWTVVAEAGLTDLGGVDFDQAIIDHLADRQGVEHWAEWDAMIAAADPVNRRLRRALETDVRDCKEALSRHPQSEVPMSEPFHDELLTRTEFEGLIRDKLIRTVDLLAEQLQRSQVPSGLLSGVYLVGGSSRIPLVARLIQERMGITPTTLDQPETSVATGALMVPPAQSATAVPPPQQYRPQGAPMQPPYGSGPVPAQGIPSGPVPVPSGQLPAQSGRVPVQSGPVPMQSGQIPGQFPQPQFAVQQPKRRNKVLLPAIAAVVVAGVVVGVILATRNGHKSDNAGKPKSSASSSVTTDPTATQTPTTTPSTNSARSSGTTVTNFDNYFSDPNVRAYMRPIYVRLDSCRPESGGETLCQLKNGLAVDVGSNVAAGRNGTIRGGSVVKPPSTSWAQKNWRRESGSGRLRTWLSKDNPDSPMLYWDRNNTVFGILGISRGSVTTANAAALRRTWQTFFER
jgi:actin-like ATPase involved in cell morphogenesis